MKRLLIALMVLGLVGCGEEETSDGYVLIKAGTFTMGSPETELERDEDELLHEVTLTRDFYMSDHEVTQAQWQALIGNNPSQLNNGTCDTCPVDSVSWWEALHYANALSRSEGLTACYVFYDCNDERTGEGRRCEEVILYNGSREEVATPYECEGYRLPTEAEWEYAARAGTSTTFYNGDMTAPYGVDPNADAIAWYRRNSFDATHPVKGKLPNAWGLYDMIGNVSEWAWDLPYNYSGNSIDPAGHNLGSNRVLRGGGYQDETRYLRTARRNIIAPDFKGAVGFRVVRTAQ